MNLTVRETWIYVGNCPICQCGLRRVRACTGSVEMPHLHGYVLCDDCETLWMQPDVNSEHTYPAIEAPVCPICRLPLYGPQSRWATEKDLQELGWWEQCTVEAAERPEPDEDLLEPEDIATDLDSPMHPDTSDADSQGHTPTPAEQLADVIPQLDEPDESAEPRPGC